MRRLYFFDPRTRNGWMLSVIMPVGLAGWMCGVLERITGHDVDFTDDDDTAVGLL